MSPLVSPCFRLPIPLTPIYWSCQAFSGDKAFGNLCTHVWSHSTHLKVVAFSAAETRPEPEPHSAPGSGVRGGRDGRGHVAHCLGDPAQLGEIAGFGSCHPTMSAPL